MTEYKIMPNVVRPTPGSAATSITAIPPAVFKAGGDALKLRLEKEKQEESRTQLGLTVLVLGCGAASFGASYLLARWRSKSP